MSETESNEVIIDGKMMNIGKTGNWREEIFQINFGADLGPADPGSDFVRIGQMSANTRGSLIQGHHTSLDIDPRVPGTRSRRGSASSAACLETIKENEIFTPNESNNDSPDRSNCWKLKHFVKILAIILLVIAYNAYIAYAIHYHMRTGRDIDWCAGLGFLIIITIIVYVSLLYFHIIKKIFPWRKARRLVPSKLVKIVNTKPGKWLLSIIVLAGISTFLIIDTKKDRQRLISAGGIIVIVLLGTIFSTSRKNIIWRQVIWGLCLQFIFGLLILRWSYGKLFFDCIGDKVCDA